MVSHVDKNGFVRFAPVGSMLRQYIPGSRVRFLNGTRGVMASERPANVSELPPLERMYLDVGAASRAHCPVKIGDVAVFDVPYMELGNRLVAKSMNNRVGVLVAIETLRNLKSVPYDVTFAFTVQQQIGARGALTSAYAIDAEIGIALDVTPVDDMLHSQGMALALGKGPCLKIQDAGMIADTRVVNWMIRAAEKKKIPYQREVLYAESTNAMAIQRMRAGMPSGCISVPVRYVHSLSEMVEFSDVQNAVRLLTAVLHTQIEL